MAKKYLRLNGQRDLRASATPKTPRTPRRGACGSGAPRHCNSFYKTTLVPILCTYFTRTFYLLLFTCHGLKAKKAAGFHRIIHLCAAAEIVLNGANSGFKNWDSNKNRLSFCYVHFFLRFWGWPWSHLHSCHVFQAVSRICAFSSLLQKAVSLFN